MSAKIHLRPTMFNIRYLPYMFEQDQYLWLANALADYLNYRKDLMCDFKNAEITITKAIHPDNNGQDHFNFIANDVTYHAYTYPKQIMMCGNIKTIGAVVYKLTAVKLVKSVIEL